MARGDPDDQAHGVRLSLHVERRQSGQRPALPAVRTRRLLQALLKKIMDLASEPYDFSRVCMEDQYACPPLGT
jgi:hypothetical protein